MKEIWSPVELRDLRLDQGRLSMRDREPLRLHEPRALHADVAKAAPAHGAGAHGARSHRRKAACGCPRSPRARAQRGRCRPALEICAENETLEVAVRDAQNQELWKWVIRGDAGEPIVTARAPRVVKRGAVVSAGKYSLEFDSATGSLVRLTASGRGIPLRGPHLAAWQRAPTLRSYVAAGAATLRKLELAPAGPENILARAEYEGALREVTWRVDGDELVVSYRIGYEGAADILGVSFDYPESSVLGKRWVGAGPYRIWKNRLAGTEFGLHEANYSRSTPGVSYEYPEFEGFFGAWDWLELRTREARIAIRNGSGIPFFGLYRPTPGEKPVIELPELGWSFLHAVPAIGTKFALPDVLGPQSQPTRFTSPIEGELRISILR